MLPKIPTQGLECQPNGPSDNMIKFQQLYGPIEVSKRDIMGARIRRPTRRSQIRAKSWMSALDDELLLSAITIPGTHDSAAFTVSWPFVATQKMSIVEQLDTGIRYFDLRCGVRNNIVEMVHGEAYLGLTLVKVLEYMYKWLSTHSSEVLVVQIKQDRKDQKSDVEFAHAVSTVISQRSELWRTANTTPCVGDVRGRIQLFRRFQGPSLYAYGIDVSRWQDNPPDPFTIYTISGVQLTIQDHYAFPEPTSLPNVIMRKGGDVRKLLQRADEDMDQEHWYINFTSAFEINIVYQLPPRQIAVGGWYFFRWKPGLNVRLRQYLKELSPQRRRFGIIAMDFPEQGTEDLVAALFKSNFEDDTSSSWQLAVALVLAIAILFGIYHCLISTASEHGFLESYTK